MPKGYWVTIYRKISDPQKLAAYAELAPKATAPFGGRYLARGTAANAYEAGLKDRIVISEFPSAEQARACYESPGYQNALKALGDGAERDVRIVAGLGERFDPQRPRFVQTAKFAFVTLHRHARPCCTALRDT